MRWLRQMPPTPCNIAAKSLRRWWLTPPRPCLYRLISPWEYRHLGVFGVMRVAAGGFQLGIGLVLLSLGRSAETDQERRKMYRLSAWFLVPAALNLVGGSWYITCDRLPPAATGHVRGSSPAGATMARCPRRLPAAERGIPGLGS